MMTRSDHIYNVYKDAVPDVSKRNQLVLSEIIQFLNKDTTISTLNDGIIKYVPKIGKHSLDEVSKFYNIDSSKWNIIRFSSEYKYMQKLSNPLNIGLIISYLETRNKIFLFYLFLVFYSSTYFKFFTKGSHNEAMMKYTIDNCSMKTDFKRYGNLQHVLEKKVDTFIGLFSNRVRPSNTYTDRDIRLMLQSIKTRVSEMMKKIYDTYKTNLNNPKVKLLLENNTMDMSGKDVIVKTENKFMTLKSTLIPNTYISGIKFNTVKIVTGNNIKLQTALNKSYQRISHAMSDASITLLDLWLKKNMKELVDVRYFFNNFVKDVNKFRYLDISYRNKVDRIAQAIISDNPELDLDMVQVKETVHKYIMFTLFTLGKEV